MTDYPHEVLSRPFGAASRAWLLEQYFGVHTPFTAEDAWKHVYELLMWIDRTTGLAHCYESDKSQPGRHWYGRSLAFHHWLSCEFGAAPRELRLHLDWLFRQATTILATTEAKKAALREARAATQRKCYADTEMPMPGEYPELEHALGEMLATHYGTKPSDEVLRALVTEVRETLRLENKRKNLVGEGFEQVLAGVISHITEGAGWTVMERKLLHEIPGFREPPKREKPRRVDLALVDARKQRRILATVKWSVRADREEQFAVDFDAYARCEESGESFEFVFITNEFDAARLVSACDRRSTAASALFNSIVHVNPEGLLQVHRGDGGETSARRLRLLIREGRLTSLGTWLESLQKIEP